MPQKTVGSAFEFAVATLQQAPDLDYQAVKERATAAGLTLPPILYGRARQQLGLPTLRPQVARPVRSVPATPPTAVPAGLAAEAEVAAPAPRARPEPADRVAEVGAEELESRTPPARPDPDRDMVAPRKAGSPAFDFALQVLRSQPDIEYRDLKARMDERGFNFPPIVFGRAKAVLGLVPVKPRGSKKAAAKANLPTIPLQLKQVESVAADTFAKKLDEVRNIDQLVAIVRELDAERRRLRAVLEQVIDTLDAALS